MWEADTAGKGGACALVAEDGKHQHAATIRKEVVDVGSRGRGLTFLRIFLLRLRVLDGLLRFFFLVALGLRLGLIFSIHSLLDLFSSPPGRDARLLDNFWWQMVRQPLQKTQITPVRTLWCAGALDMPVIHSCGEARLRESHARREPAQSLK